MEEDSKLWQIQMALGRQKDQWGISRVMLVSRKRANWPHDQVLSLPIRAASEAGSPCMHTNPGRQVVKASEEKKMIKNK